MPSAIVQQNYWDSTVHGMLTDFELRARASNLLADQKARVEKELRRKQTEALLAERQRQREAAREEEARQRRIQEQLAAELVRFVLWVLLML
jgi:hypothetical protein